MDRIGRKSLPTVGTNFYEKTNRSGWIILEVQSKTSFAMSTMAAKSTVTDAFMQILLRASYSSSSILQTVDPRLNNMYTSVVL